MALVDRDHELSVLERLYEDCVRGKGSVALITGTIGSGKTALLHTFADWAVKSGAVFLSAAASRAERALPLGVLTQLFRTLELPPEDSERTTGLLNNNTLGLMANEIESEAAEHATHQLYELCETLLSLDQRGPMLIAVDDLHCADVSSLRCVSYLARRLSTSRILLVLTESALPPRVHPMFGAELLRQPYCRQIRLTPLSHSGVTRLLAEQVGADTARRLAPACHAMGVGNPLLTQALIRDCHPETPDEVVFGDAFRRAVHACLSSCEPAVLSIARVIAVLGDEAPAILAAELLDLNVEFVGQAIRALEEVGLCVCGRYRHEAIRKAVLDGIDPKNRTTMHNRAAVVMREIGAPAPVLAKHLALAGHIDEPWVVPTLQEAADQSLEERDTGLAVGYLRLAAKVCSDERQRTVIYSALAQAEWRVDPSTAIRRLPELTKAVRDGQLEGRHVTRPINYLLWNGRTAEAVEILDRLEQLSDGTTPWPTEVATEIDNTLLWLRYSYPELLGDRVYDFSLPAAESAVSALNPQRRAYSVLATVLTKGPNSDTVAEAEQILQSVALDDRGLTPIVITLAALLFADRPDIGAYWCDSLLKKARDPSTPTWSALLSAVWAMIEVRRGNIAAAGEYADSALTGIGPRSWGVAIGAPLTSALHAATVMGQYARAESYLETPVPEAMFQTPCGALYLHARGGYFLATGRLYAALSDLLACGKLLARWNLDLAALVPWRVDVAMTRLRMGDRVRAQELAREQLAMLSPGHRRTRGIALRALADACDAEDRLPLLWDSADLLLACGDRYELALTYEAFGRAYQALGEHHHAREKIQRAHIVAEQCGVELSRPTVLRSADRAQADVPRNLAEHDRLARLSDAESRVAVLAAQGLTNQEISEKCCITVSTVEQHLTRVYRKLEVSRRNDLPLELQQAQRRFHQGEPISHREI